MAITNIVANDLDGFSDGSANASVYVQEGVLLASSGGISALETPGINARVVVDGAVISHGGSGIAAFGAGSTIIIGATGSVSGYTFASVFMSGAGNTLINAGLVTTSDPGFVAAVLFSGWDDSVIVNSGSIIGRGNGIFFNAGASSASVVTIDNSGLIQARDAIQTSGPDIEIVSNSGTIRGNISLAGEGDSLTNTGAVTGAVDMGDGNDTIDNSGGTITGAVALGNGVNGLTNTDGRIVGNVSMGDDGDILDNTDGRIRGSVSMGEGSDFVNNTGGTILRSVSFGVSSDVLRNTDGRILGDVTMNFGDDLVDTTGGSIFGLVSLGFGADTYIGGDFTDRVLGGQGSDIVDLGGGRDSYFAYEGDDSDEVDGGDGIDTYIALDSSTGVTIDLDAGIAAGTSIGTDVITGFENVTGTFVADDITGDDANNILRGYDGRDELTGGVGNDTLDGGIDNDTMSGGGGNDIYRVDNNSDTVIEAAGGGSDKVISTVTVTLAAEVERLALSGTAAINGGGNALVNIITGNSASNYLYGYLGNDTITGGGGADFFVFNTAISPTSNIDRITDFSPADDTMLLDDAVFSAISPAGTLAGSKFVSGTAALDAADRIIYNPTTGAVLYDADGTGAAAAIQFAKLGVGLAVSNLDFIIY
ncbi:hypothetical protein BH10PSE7_BH10PSE7_27790 [soil metagenome]